MFVGIILRDCEDYKYIKNSLIRCLNEFNVVPLFLVRENINSLINKCNGFILPGGDNFSDIEDEVIKYAIREDKPLFGICLGMQALACFSVKEDQLLDLTTRNMSNAHKSRKKYVHKIIINRNSLLYKLLKKDKINVNSRHKTHVEKVKFKVVATSKDGIIEGVELQDKKFILGVQWHPEDMIFYDKEQYKLMEYFIHCCKRN